MEHKGSFVVVLEHRTGARYTVCSECLLPAFEGGLIPQEAVALAARLLAVKERVRQPFLPGVFAYA